MSGPLGRRPFIKGAREHGSAVGSLLERTKRLAQRLSILVFFLPICTAHGNLGLMRTPMGAAPVLAQGDRSVGLYTTRAEHPCPSA